MKRTRSSLQKLLAGAVIAFAIWHGIVTLFERGRIHPFTNLGWVNEQIGVSVLLLVVGVGLALSDARSGIGALLSALSLSVLCMAIFLRYFWVSLALFTVFGLLDALLITRTLPGASPLLRRVAMAGITGTLIAELCFFFASFFWVGN